MGCSCARAWSCAYSYFASREPEFMLETSALHPEHTISTPLDHNPYQLALIFANAEKKQVFFQNQSSQ